MIKKIGLVVASFAAVAVIFAGARTFAGGDNCKGHAKTASATSADVKSCCANKGAAGAAMTAGSSCSGTKTAGATCSGMKTAGGAGCSSKSAMASGSTCGSKMTTAGHPGCSGHKGAASKAAYAANVYQVKDGHQYAVARGKTFEVTAETPYYEVGTARYYFADKESMSACAEKMASLAAELDGEAVSLATTEVNVTTDSYGKKYGTCPVTNDKFLITADSPAKVMDGQKYYVCSEKCAHDLVQAGVQADQTTAH